MIYVAGPYNHVLADVREARYKALTRYALHLVQQGLHVHSPITSNHPMAVMGGLPTGWEYWKSLDEYILSFCTEMHILMIDGFLTSVGVENERKIANRLNLPVYIVQKDTYEKRRLITRHSEFSASVILGRPSPAGGRDRKTTVADGEGAQQERCDSGCDGPGQDHHRQNARTGITIQHEVETGGSAGGGPSGRSGGSAASGDQVRDDQPVQPAEGLEAVQPGHEGTKDQPRTEGLD